MSGIAMMGGATMTYPGHGHRPGEGPQVERERELAKKIGGGFKRLFGKKEPVPPGTKSLDDHLALANTQVKSLDEPLKNRVPKSFDS